MNLNPPRQYTGYDKGAALEFFKAAGTPETVAEGATLFVEHQRAGRHSISRDKMYLLLQGRVEILAARKPIGAIKQGEIFGEMGPLSGTARSATAVARTPCQVIGLDEQQLRRGLEMKPDFVPMMARLMISRLRDTVARLRTEDAIAEDDSGRQTALFSPALLDDMRHDLGAAAHARFKQGETILREGATGILMYIVLEGCVSAHIQGRLVERIGPGGLLGEIALVDLSPRVASAIAQTDCELLVINRSLFLQLLRDKPEFGASLLRGLADRLRFLISHGR
ncbi:MAG: cyclic nucleotide-binding domain-containing protein [Betaproteobacteria bacterium]|nr:cyclic nucleotide-binding domain-containing protein [Betaproteobacteria bacterium]